MFFYPKEAKLCNGEAVLMALKMRPFHSIF